MRSYGRPVRPVGPVLATVLLLAAGPALAGAWTRPKGEGQVIVTMSATGAAMGGMLGSAADGTEGRTATQVYAEYGLREGLTIGAKGFFETGTAEDGTFDGAASVGAFLRRRVWQDEAQGAVASVQIEAQAPVEEYIDPAFAVSKPFSTTEVGLRGQYGRSWWGDWGSAFASLEGAYTWRGEGQSADLRFDTTIGYQPGSRWMALLSVNALSPLADTGTEASLKLRPSVAIHLGEPVEGRRPTSVQFGISHDILGDDGGPAVFIGLWRRF